jgi:hypothetical protein
MATKPVFWSKGSIVAGPAGPSNAVAKEDDDVMAGAVGLVEMKSKEEAALGLLLLQALPDATIEADFKSLGVATADEAMKELEKLEPKKGGGRKYRQRGGATWDEVGAAIRGLGQRMAGPFTAAAAAAPDAMVAFVNGITLRNTLNGLAWGGAGAGVMFGPPEMPWITEALWAFVQNIPAAALEKVYNAIATVKYGAIQTGLIGSIATYAFFVALLIILVKACLDMLNKGNITYPQALKAVLLDIAVKVGVLKRAANGNIAPPETPDEAQAIVAIDTATEVATVGALQTAAAATGPAAAGAAAGAAAAVVASTTAGVVSPPPKPVKYTISGTNISISGLDTPATKARALMFAGQDESRLTKTIVQPAAAAGGQGGGRRRRHTRKHHSRRHKRRQSHRRRRISRRG